MIDKYCTFLEYIELEILSLYNTAYQILQTSQAAESAVRNTFQVLTSNGNSDQINKNYNILIFKALIDNICSQCNIDLKQVPAIDQELTEFYLYNKLNELVPLYIDKKEEFIDRNLSVHDINHILKQLPCHFRIILILHDLENLSYSDINKITGIPYKIVISSLQTGRKLFQRYLWQEISSTYKNYA